MSKKQYKLQTLVIELVSVLIASFVAFQVCNSLSVQLGYFPFVLVGCYIVLKLIYHICILVVGYSMKLIPIIIYMSHFPLVFFSIVSLSSPFYNIRLIAFSFPFWSFGDYYTVV